MRPRKVRRDGVTGYQVHVEHGEISATVWSVCRDRVVAQARGYLRRLAVRGRRLSRAESMDAVRQWRIR
jgi:hypothetical protein